MVVAAKVQDGVDVFSCDVLQVRCHARQRLPDGFLLQDAGEGVEVGDGSR